MRIVTAAETGAMLREQLDAVIGPERAQHLADAAGALRQRLNGSTLWHVNSTAAGGGVAEMLHVLLPLYRELGVDARWMVIDGDERFFSITKGLGIALYGGDGAPAVLDNGAKADYLRTLQTNAEQMRAVVRPSDVLFLHDHQTAGLLPFLRGEVKAVFWRCHVGVDVLNEAATAAWRFLGPWASLATATVFSVPWHVPPFLRRGRVAILPPFISPAAVKNAGLDAAAAEKCLRRCGLLAATGPGTPSDEVRVAGRHIRLCRDVAVVQDRPPSPDEPLLAQVSRWDRLKDMHGVMRSFAASVSRGYLALAGPDPAGIPDDIDQELWYHKCLDEWAALPPVQRQRIALICLPMADLNENALLVNAIQSAAQVVLQKSLAEGFGLTVTEAMWKSRPVVASAVGGIRDQITHGREGLLTGDPEDLAGFGRLVDRAASASGRAGGMRAMGRRAHDKVRRAYLPDREVVTTAGLLASA